MQPYGETVLEIDLNALRHNYQYITRHLSPNTKVLGVVKAFGYGSDAIAIAKELVSLGVDYFGVAYAPEGVALRDAGIETPILVLHPLEIHFDQILERCLEPNLYSQKIFQSFLAFAQAQNQRQYPVHLKINTGLNRLGFSPEQTAEIGDLLKQQDHIKVRSVLSHLAASEDPQEKEFSDNQIARFTQAADRLEAQLGYAPMRHTLNTSGILNFPQAQFDMVRTGIGLYGFGNQPEHTAELRPVAKLYSVITQIHSLKAGESLGYNRGYVADKSTRTATLPLGHADGISRAFGHGKGWVTIRGQKAPILGNVCMDMLMVDVTDIPCEEGDMVTVFGDSPSAEDLATAINSIPYELLTAISQRVKRVVSRKS